MKEPLGRIEKVPVDIFAETVVAAKTLINSGRNLGYDWTSPEGFMTQHLETLGVSMLRNKPLELLELSGVDADNFLALLLGLAYSLEAGHDIPKEARLWLARYLRNEIKRPKQKRGRKNNPGLEVLIYFAVEGGVRRGLTATRNEAARHNLSACDAVAVALGEMKMAYANFDSVKDIWEAGKRHFAKPENQAIPAT